MIIDNINTTRGVQAFLLSLVIVFSSGCGLIPFARKTVAKISTPSGTQLTQSGPVDIPSHVETKKTTTEIPLSSHSTVSIVAATETSPAIVTVKEPATASIVRTEISEALSGPKPPAPPTVLEQAKADGVRSSYYVAGILALLGFAALYFQHAKAGGLLVLSALLLPSLAQFASSELAYKVTIGIAALGVGIFVAYYLAKNNPNFLADGRANLESLERQIRSRADNLRESLEKKPPANP